ncbi:YeiH family protein [Pseudalkalibacillus hwajinpoensis]|uniref:YeiH family protein n=1 Tax=Guptibacillus hwajinpoensis TaxID=208199 RepID=UPI001CD4FA28|nr:YeiH family protein [Pseudalkalibacillus hwajinpoensis]MCA0993475.1 YeiH family protein [Pseudalkalibacillus hwajinpoensis]
MQPEKIRNDVYDEHDEPTQKKASTGYTKGILLTLTLAIVAGQIATLPFFSILGIMILAILLGAVWGNTVSVSPETNLGIKFSSKVLLRAGIILLGFRLNLQEILASGFSILLTDVIVILFTMLFIMFLARAFNIDRKLGTLLAAGTAICGAAAIVALAPIVKSKEQHTAIAVSCIAVLGTVGAILYIFLFPVLPITEQEYGFLVGATLHELAHVVAAGVPGGEISGDSAILVKLGRVLLLIPVALIVSFLYNGKKNKGIRDMKSLPIPWFIFGFLGISFFNTLVSIPENITNMLLIASTYLLAMGMAGLGLNIKWADFVKVGFKPVVTAVIGFIGLLATTPLLLFLYRLFS